jgi:hypothetical protein
VSIEVADLRNIGDARPVIDKALREFATDDETAADVIRVVSELLSRSLGEGQREPVRLAVVRLPGRVRIAVLAPLGKAPSHRPQVTGGAGPDLPIVESASRAWGIDLRPPRRVWNPVGFSEPS